MKVNGSLIWMFFKQVSLANTAAFGISICYILLAPKVLGWRNPWMSLLILAHSIAIASMLGRYRSRSFAFLYTRGYTRDDLWLNKMIASLLSVLTLWLPISLMLWLGIRSGFQDQVARNPYFPLMMEREAAVPWIWLGGYAILLPLFHYVWIRRAQPLRGENGIVLLAIGVIVTMGTLMLFPWHYDWFRTLCCALACVAVVVTVLAGRILHRSIEVY